ncbi:MAG: transporter [bacterium]
MVRYILLFFCLLAFTPFSSLAQSDTTPSGVSEEAAEALGEDRGKTEEEQLEEILSSQRSEYDLIKQGNFQLDYDVSYSFNSNPRSQIVSQNDTGFIINNLTRDSQHTLNHRVNLRYGLFNYLTTGFSLPVVSKFNSANDQSVSAFGDLSLSTRYQPYVVKPGQAKVTLNSSLSIPTGRSSYEIDRDQELSTGSGLYSASGGINFSKAFDPVVAFGNFSANYTLPRDNIDQRRRSGLLKKIEPGPSFSWGLGMAYSLSYDVSINYSFSYSVSMPSQLTFIQPDGSTNIFETDPSTSATLNFSTGWRIDPRYQLNVSLGIGLTDNAPAFSISTGFPLVLESPAYL